MKELFRLVFLLLSLCSFGYAQNCYYEGGVSATDYSYKPCSTTAASPCCIPGESDVCLSSGMCYYPEKNYFYRGACTDETWSDEGNCPQYCLTENPTGWLEFALCDNNKFCCQNESTSSCCNDVDNIFTISDYWVVNDYGQSTVVPGTIAPPTSSLAITTTPPTSSLTISATMTTTPPTSSLTISATMTTTPTPTSTSTRNTSDSENNSGSGISTGQLVGAVVTPVCTMIGIIFVAWINRERIKRTMHLETAPSEATPSIGEDRAENDNNKSGGLIIQEHEVSTKTDANTVVSGSTDNELRAV